MWIPNTGMKALILTITLLGCSVLTGCRTQSIAVAGNGKASSSEYETVNLLTLSVGKDGKVLATIENLNNSIRAIPGQKPRAKLVIKNLSTDKIIHEEECGDSTLSYPGFGIGSGSGLVMTTKGGSGDGIRVYEVGQSDARVVLDEAYRANAIMMPNDELGGDMGFLIVDSESGTSPLVVRRYQYDDRSKKYVLTGKTSFSEFIRSVKTQFGKPAK
ncbi:MAG: hypothetical protein ACRD9S_04535 [Pyrinomonadaceae bacterium]